MHGSKLGIVQRKNILVVVVVVVVVINGCCSGIQSVVVGQDGRNRVQDSR